MNKTVVASSSVIIIVLLGAAILQKTLMSSPRYKNENRSNRTAEETDKIYYPDNPIVERSSSSSSGSSGYESARGSFGGNRKTKRSKRI